MVDKDNEFGKTGYIERPSWMRAADVEEDLWTPQRLRAMKERPMKCGRAPSRTNWFEFERGTPMGELLRRYWHPVGLSTDASATPRKVRALGEDLILFRDGAGRAGLLHPRCCHRGTTLYYGKVEERGIRCCYHGWLFDAQGHCLEQPCEPEGGRSSDAVRQPWYPVEERYGLIFAYMGPPERKPVLPRYECLEKLDEGEFVEADDTSLGGGGPAIIPCNWLQHFENVIDPFHVPILHGSFSGAQFTEADGADAAGDVRDVAARRVACARRAGWRTARSFIASPRRRCRRCAWCRTRASRNSRRVESIGWVLPIDDTIVPHLRRRPREAAGRHRPHALEDERQVLVGPDRGGTPALPRRLRGAGRPGPDHAPFRGAFRASPTAASRCCAGCCSDQLEPSPKAAIRSASASIRPRRRSSSKPATTFGTREESS